MTLPPLFFKIYFQREAIQNRDRNYIKRSKFFHFTPKNNLDRSIYILLLHIVHISLSNCRKKQEQAWICACKLSLLAKAQGCLVVCHYESKSIRKLVPKVFQITSRWYKAAAIVFWLFTINKFENGKLQ